MADEIATLKEEIVQLREELEPFEKRLSIYKSIICVFITCIVLLITSLFISYLEMKDKKEESNTYQLTCDLGCPGITEELADQTYPNCDLAVKGQIDTRCYNPGPDQCCSWSNRIGCLNRVNFTICRTTLHCITKECHDYGKKRNMFLIFIPVVLVVSVLIAYLAYWIKSNSTTNKEFRRIKSEIGSRYRRIYNIEDEIRRGTQIVSSPEPEDLKEENYEVEC